MRIAWCLDHTTSPDNAKAELGWDIYATVTDSPLITATEREVLLAVAGRSARRALAEPPEVEDNGTENEQEDPR